jgi:hypothetical protein
MGRMGKSIRRVVFGSKLRSHLEEKQSITASALILLTGMLWQWLRIYSHHSSSFGYQNMLAAFLVLGP